MMATPPSLAWSAQLSVATNNRAHILPGDKITLPPSALEQLLAASANAAAEHARNDLPAYDPYNSATYSAYRQAESQYQDQRQQLPHPLTFRLVNPANGRVVYAGVREFSAEEGEAELSPFLRESLGLKDEEQHGSSEAEAIVIDDEPQHTAESANRAAITVHAKQLPKGTFVKLRPLEPGYDPEDWKALLEQHLRNNYTTLTNGEVLVVQHGRGLHGKKEEYRFLVDLNTDGVCIVDTDLEVDIEALNEEQARETMKRIAEKMTRTPGSEQGSSAGGELDLFNAQEGQVLPGDYVDYILPSWNRAQALEVELSGEDGEDDIDLIVSPFSATQRSKPRVDEFVFADLSGRPRKRVRLEPTNAELEKAEALYVSVHAFAAAELQSNGNHTNGSQTQSPRRFTLRATHPKSGSLAEPDKENEEERNPDDVQCGNCHQWVPKARLVLHENFCLRHNILCPQGCTQVFQKASSAYQDHWHCISPSCDHQSTFGNTAESKVKHDSLYHPGQVLRCNDCSTQETFPNVPALAHHRTTTCPAKLILCRFCHLEVPQEGDPDIPNAEAMLSGMAPHELADGARTTECHMCSKIVRLRDMETHLKSHDLDRLSRPPPQPCRNINCGRTLDTCSKSGDTRAGTRMGQGNGNDVGLCSVCFGPLYVSMYDPEGKALRRRVERRYLQQLVTGCGKPFCRNTFCKTGRKHLDDRSPSVSTKEALPMIKPFLDGLTNAAGGSPLHFCVDEGTQRRRKLAEMLAAEEDVSGKGGYGPEWVVGALEAAGGDVSEARTWLKNFAPRKMEEGKR